jgi:hypothetical protein
MRTVGVHEHLDISDGFSDSDLIGVTFPATVVQDDARSSLLGQRCGFVS